MGSPRHLWTGSWRDDSERAREEAAEAIARQQREQAATAGEGPPADAGEPAGRQRGTVMLAAAIALAAVIGGAFAAGLLLSGNDDNGPAPLPAVASEPIKPHKGHTQAGAIYAAASPAVVSIRTQEGEGTGFLIDDKGTLVTNDHVVGTSTHVTVRFGQDGTSLDGDVLGADPSSDLAVVSIDPDREPKNAKPLKFADSRAVQVGDTAIAIGNPFGLDRTATEGIISGLGRTIQAPNHFSIDDVIQTDAPINPGNSGGPLLDDAGHVIGVNAQIATAGVGGNIGIGFAIPSNTVRSVIPRLEKGQSIDRPWLGVSNEPVSLTDPDAGAKVAEVTPGSPSAKAGVDVGDIIKRVDGQTIKNPDDVANAISAEKPGETIVIEVERGGRSVTLHVKLGTRPDKIP